jgi:hypothetical protein
MRKIVIIEPDPGAELGTLIGWAIAIAFLYSIFA